MENLEKLGVRARRSLNKDLLFEAGYCTDCGNTNDRAHIKRTCSKCLQDAKRYYTRNREKRAASMKAWAIANPERAKQVRKNRTIKLKREAIGAYGGCCQCCGETIIQFLCLDHINGGGLKHRTELRCRGSGEFYYHLKKNKWPTDPPLRVLCYNCNQGRQINGGVCPHKGQ